MMNPSYSRLRILAWVIAFIALSLAFRLVPWFALGFLGDASATRNTAVGALALGGVVLLTRALVRRRPALLADDGALVVRADAAHLRRGLGGVLAGAVLFALVYGGVIVTGGLADFHLLLHGGELAALVGVMLVATVLSAAWEEYTFRGWPFLVGARVLGPHAVAIGIGLVFGSAHMLNPGWTVAAIVSVSAAGWLLSYVMLAFRSISVPIGLHVGWNLTQSLLTSKRLWSYTANPNPWLSGGAYGLEASAVGLAVTVLAAAVSLGWFLRVRRAGMAGQGA